MQTVSVARDISVEFGPALTIWSARVSCVVYALTLMLLFRRHWKAARFASTVAATIYLVHVWAAFEFVYNWSHTFAYVETARQTAQLFGVNWGGGLILNYVFTAVWVVDCAWWWWKPHAPQRSLPGLLGIHAFLIFMFVNASIVVWLLRLLRSVEA